MAEFQDLSVTDASNTARFPENQSPSSLNNGARALEGLIARTFGDLFGPNLPVATLSGSVIQFTSNRTSITLTGTTSNYFANFMSAFLMGSNPSIDGASVRINDIQTISLRDNRGQTLSSSAIPAGSYNIVIKDATNNYFRLLFSAHTLFNPTLTGTVNLSGGQIAFPATQSASAGANTLDDYEEGTFTPTIFGNPVAGLGTYSTQVGRYTKIGNRVFVLIHLVWSAHTGSTETQIGGLPFTTENTSGNNPTWSVYADAMTFPGTLAVSVDRGTTNLTLLSFATGAASAGVTLDTAATLRLSGEFEV